MERASSQPFRIAVCSSGISRGSNLRAIVDYIRNYRVPMKVEFVVTNNSSSPIIDYCRIEKITTEIIPTTSMTYFESSLLNLIRLRHIDIIVLAGFMRKLSAEFIDSCHIPILNIHPALLPKYGGKGMYGHFVHEAVFANHEKESGATVHLVNKNYDEGSIISQERIDITNCHSADDIAQSVLEVEHRIYGPAIYKIALEYNKH